MLILWSFDAKIKIAIKIRLIAQPYITHKLSWTWKWNESCEPPKNVLWRPSSGSGHRPPAATGWPRPAGRLRRRLLLPCRGQRDRGHVQNESIDQGSIPLRIRSPMDTWRVTHDTQAHIQTHILTHVPTHTHTLRPPAHPSPLLIKVGSYGDGRSCRWGTILFGPLLLRQVNEFINFAVFIF